MRKAGVKLGSSCVIVLAEIGPAINSLNSRVTILDCACYLTQQAVKFPIASGTELFPLAWVNSTSAAAAASSKTSNKRCMSNARGYADMIDLEQLLPSH